jgi:hypothetical protein
LVKDGRQDLRQIERVSANAATEAEREEQMSQSLTMTVESHAASLNQIRDDLNRIGREVKKLEAEQQSLAPWQREALMRTVPLLKDAAEKTNHAIRFLNENMNDPWAKGTLHEDARQIAQDCHDVKHTLQSFMKLDNATRQEKDAREHLAIQSGS